MGGYALPLCLYVGGHGMETCRGGDYLAIFSFCYAERILVRNPENTTKCDESK